MTRTKICGCTRAADVDAAVEAGADAVGVIVDVPVDTPREVSPDAAAALLDRVPPLVTAVLVTMATDRDRVVSLAERTGADAVQVHGGHAPGSVATLRDRLPTPVLAAVGPTDDVAAYAEAADALVLDSRDEDGGGGTGRTHDWDRAAARVDELDVPVLLAGGLTPGNVGEAVRTVDPFGVDVASGVEAAGGEKDHDAVERFVAAVAAADREVSA